MAAGFSILLLLPCDVAAQGAAPSGEQTYKQYCASCHDQTSPRIPSREALRKLPATRIEESLRVIHGFEKVKSVAELIRLLRPTS